MRNIVVEAVFQTRIVDGLNDFGAAGCNPIELHLLTKLGVGLGQLHVYALVTVNDGRLSDLARRQHFETNLGANLLVTVHPDESRANPYGGNGQNDVDKRSAKKLLNVHDAS
ncbi:unannotated protein [freshwater metagenome]|uniref:Unannotated protein n=1 Tax=freshwater metagenome TaxID=449393 RepID=A0A6J7GVS1_9ZZZZ